MGFVFFLVQSKIFGYLVLEFGLYVIVVELMVNKGNTCSIMKF